MRFSVWPSASYDWPTLRQIAADAEASGWDGFWLADHFMPNTEAAEGDVHECLALLAGVAAVTDRLRLGSLVLGNLYRHPAVVANAARTIDEISGGRFVLGMGAGWQINEHAKFGIELPTPGPRLRQFTEALQILRAMLDEERATVAGEFYSVTDAPLSPKAPGPVPLLVGGSGEKVMPRIVASYAEEWNTWGDPERFAQKSTLMSQACERIGRDPSTLARSTQAIVHLGEGGAERAAEQNPIRPSIGGTVAQLIDVVGAYAEAGLDELIIPAASLPVGAARDLWATVIEEIAPNFR